VVNFDLFPMQGRPAPGLLPVRFDWPGRRVELLDLAGAEYREPFFHETVARWRRDHPEARSIELDLPAFIAAVRVEPIRAPSGLIYHVGRCGSTLLANMLAVPRDHLVLKESLALNAVLSQVIHWGYDAGEVRRAQWEGFARLVFSYLAWPAPGTERRLLVKLSSWAIVLAGTLDRLLPNTPAVYLHREAEAVVGSMLATPPGFDNLRSQPRHIAARFFPSLASEAGDLSPLRFYAHVWRSVVEQVLAQPAGRLLVLEYGDLTTDPGGTARRVLDHFGLRVEADAADRMAALQRVYAKDPRGSERFDAANSHARPPLDSAQRAELAEIIGDLPSRFAEWRADGVGRPGV
jgi:hypothetical protein